jgi:hypothetical protein
MEGIRRTKYFEDSIVQLGQQPIIVAGVKELGFIADANLGLEYRYNKRLSAFIQLNNLASQGYMRWYNYPVQRFQFMGGIAARL